MALAPTNAASAAIPVQTTETWPTTLRRGTWLLPARSVSCAASSVRHVRRSGNTCPDLTSSRPPSHTPFLDKFKTLNKYSSLDLLKLDVYLGSFEDLDRTIETLYFKNMSNKFECCQCGHISSQKPNIVNHIESKHVSTPGVVCDVCHKHLRTRQAYRMHYHREHGPKWSCD